MDRSYAYLKSPVVKTEYNHAAEFYVKGAAYTNEFYDNNDNILDGKWSLFAAHDGNNNEIEVHLFGDKNLKMPSPLDAPPIHDATKGYYAQGRVVLKWDIPGGIPPINLPPITRPYQESLPDSDRDELVDVGIDFDIFNETGTAYWLPEQENPQIIIPLHRTRRLPNPTIAWDYISFGGSNDDIIKLDYSYSMSSQSSNYCYFPSNTYLNADNLNGRWARSLETCVFNDLLIDDSVNEVYVKRIGVLRPRGQVAIFDFKWNDTLKKFDDVGVPIGINKDRKYRLIVNNVVDHNPQLINSFWQRRERYTLQFDNGIVHAFYPGYATNSYGQSCPIEYIRFKEQINFVRYSMYYMGQNNKNMDYNYDIDFEVDQLYRPSTFIYAAKDGSSSSRVSIIYDEEGTPVGLHKEPPHELSSGKNESGDVSIRGDLISYPDGTSMQRISKNENNGKTVSLIYNYPETGSYENRYQYNQLGMLTSISTIKDTDIAKTEFAYYDGDGTFTNNTFKRNKLRSILYPDGSWKYFKYDANGQICTVYSPLRSIPVPTSEPDASLCKTLEFSYQSHEKDDFIDNKMLWEAPRTITAKYEGQITGIKYFSYILLSHPYYMGRYSTRKEQIASDLSSGWDSIRNISSAVDSQMNYFSYSEYPNIFTGPFRHISNKLTTNGYQTSQEAYNVSRGGCSIALTNLKISSDVKDCGDNIVMKEETNINPRGVILDHSLTEVASGKIIDSTHSIADSFGRIAKTTYLDGTSEQFNDYCLYGPQEHVDRNGNVFRYKYGPAGLVSEMESPLVTEKYSYDALGNMTSKTTIPKSAGETRKESWSYDALSRILSHTDSVGTTSYAYDGPSVTITYPDGSTKIIRKNLDGTTASISGTAVSPVSYEYSIKDGMRCTREIRGSAWSDTYYNMLGNICRTENSAGLRTDIEYDSKARPIKTTESFTDEVTGNKVVCAETVTTYNSKNEIASITRNGITTNYENSVVSQNGKTALKNVRTTQSSNGNISSESIRSVDGRDSWSSVNGRSSESHTTLLGDGATKTESKDFMGRSSASISSNFSYEYDFNSLVSGSSKNDSFGRTLCSSDSINSGIISASFRPGTSQPAQIKFSGVPGIISHLYAHGRQEPISTTLPDGSTVSYEYDPKGALVKASDTAPGIFNSRNAYDTGGRLSSITTHGSRGDVKTEMSYHQASGMLKEKKIGPDSAYELAWTPDGLLKKLTRKTGEGGSQASKKFTYSPDYHRYLLKAEWDDGTPSVEFSGHNSLGQPAKITTNGICDWNFTYNRDGQVTDANFALLSAAPVDQTYSYSYNDKMLRSRMTSGGDTVDYGYDKHGRLSKITAGRVSAAYDYLEGAAAMISRITVSVDAVPLLIREIGYEPGSARVAYVTNMAPSGKVYNSFQYAYNLSGKIASMRLADGSEFRYDYDQRGQLASATKYSGAAVIPESDYAYNADSIANVLESGKRKADGSSESRCTPTIFNSIATRTVGDKVEVTGSAVEEAVISVNNVRARRLGSAFSATVDAGNRDSASLLEMLITGVLFDENAAPELGGNLPGNAKGADIVASLNAQVFMPKAEDNFVYDKAGRLVSNSLYSCTWDSEDRLTSIATNGTKLSFAYDHQGRRISKKVFVNPSSSNNGSTTTDNCSLIADHSYHYDTVLLDGSTADFGILTDELVTDHLSLITYHSHYVWGLDLDGSYQGLGGAGGLLAVSTSVDDQGASIHIPLYDAKGTVHAYLDAGTGAISANFAYDPFGRVIEDNYRSTINPPVVGSSTNRSSTPRNSSRMTSNYSPVTNNYASPFRFQSKYYDPEIRMYYFGFRYYDPATCKWLNRDPLEESGGLNLYAFCLNDPVNFIDYLGARAYGRDYKGPIDPAWDWVEQDYTQKEVDKVYWKLEKRDRHIYNPGLDNPSTYRNQNKILLEKILGVPVTMVENKTMAETGEQIRNLSDFIVSYKLFYDLGVYMDHFGENLSWCGGKADFLVAGYDKTFLPEFDQAIKATRFAYKKAIAEIGYDGYVYGWMHSEGAIHGAAVLNTLDKKFYEFIRVNTLGAGTHVFPEALFVDHWVNVNKKGEEDPVPLYAAGDIRPDFIYFLGEVPYITHPYEIHYIKDVEKVTTHYSNFGDQYYVHGFPTYAKYAILPLAKKYFRDNAKKIIRR